MKTAFLIMPSTLPTATSPCTHHWMIGEIIPNQPRNKGTCKYCGEIKIFLISLDELTYREIQNAIVSNPATEIAAYIASRSDREI